MTLTCETCNHTFTRIANLKRHLNNICPAVKRVKRAIESSMEEKLITIKRENLQLIQENTTLKSELDALKEKNARSEGKLEVAQVLVDTVQQRSDRLEKHILRENSKPRNNVFINLAPYTLTQELSEKLCEKYTEEHFHGGPEATYGFILENHLTSEDGRRLLACTDSARKIFKGVDADGAELIVGQQQLSKDIVKPLRKAITKVGARILADAVDEPEEMFSVEKKRYSHCRSLEPARLGKRLAEELR